MKPGDLAAILCLVSQRFFFKKGLLTRVALKKHPSGQVFPRLHFSSVRIHIYSCFDEIWPFFGRPIPETNPPFCDTRRAMPNALGQGVSKKPFPNFWWGDATKFVGGAAFGGVFGKRLKHNSWSCFVLWVSSRHFEKIVKRWYISVYYGSRRKPFNINTISAVDDIKKVSCLDFDGKSVTKSSQRNPTHSHFGDVWISHASLIQAKWCETSPVQLRLFHRDATGVGLVTDTLGITKNAEDGST